jgi:hypothetical protein
MIVIEITQIQGRRSQVAWRQDSPWIQGGFRHHVCRVMAIEGFERRYSAVEMGVFLAIPQGWVRTLESENHSGLGQANLSNDHVL